MSFVAFLLAVFASYCSFMEGFPLAAAGVVNMGSIPEWIRELVDDFADELDITLDTVKAIQNPELLKSSWLFMGAAIVGVIGGLICFSRKKKTAAALLLASAALCCAGGFIPPEQTGFAFAVYAFMFLLAAFFKSAAKSAPSEKIKASPSASPSLSVSANSEKIILNKDEKINLTKHYPISKIIVRLGWKVGFDLDASAFLLTSNGKVTRNADFVFYGQRADASGAVTHMGDDKTGDTGEELRVDLERVPQYVSRIVFTVTIYDGEKLDQNFGKVSSAFISVLDEKNSRELLRYDLANKFSTETAVVCGELYRDGSEWDFKAIGNGFNGGLEALCRHYGVNV